jgi:hypothetical protein
MRAGGSRLPVDAEGKPPPHHPLYRQRRTLGRGGHRGWPGRPAAVRFRAGSGRHRHVRAWTRGTSGVDWAWCRVGRGGCAGGAGGGGVLTCRPRRRAETIPGTHDAGPSTSPRWLQSGETSGAAAAGSVARREADPLLKPAHEGRSDLRSDQTLTATPVSPPLRTPGPALDGRR